MNENQLSVERRCYLGRCTDITLNYDFLLKYCLKSVLHHLVGLILSATSGYVSDSIIKNLTEFRRVL